MAMKLISFTRQTSPSDYFKTFNDPVTVFNDGPRFIKRRSGERHPIRPNQAPAKYGIMFMALSPSGRMMRNVFKMRIMGNVF